MLQDCGIPIVALDRVAAGFKPTRCLSRTERARTGVRHLIEHGHERIACVGFDSGSYTCASASKLPSSDARRRSAAYFSATMSTLLRPWSRWCFAGRVERTSRPRFLRKADFFRSSHPGIALSEDTHAGTNRVVGFDDFELAEVLGTPLTVVRQSPNDLRTLPPSCCSEDIDCERRAMPTQKAAKVLFPVELIVRRSCGCFA